MSLFQSFFWNDSKPLIKILTTPVSNNKSQGGLCCPGINNNNNNNANNNNNNKRKKVDDSYKLHQYNTDNKIINIGNLNDLVNDYDNHDTNNTIENKKIKLVNENIELYIKPIQHYSNDNNNVNHNYESELEQYCSESFYRDPTIIPLTHTLFNNLIIPQYHISIGNTTSIDDNNNNNNIKTRMIEYQTNIYDVEKYKSSFIREMTVSCGLLTIMNRNTIFIPGCSKDHKCIGYSGMIEGLNSDIKGVKLRAFITPTEWKYIQQNKIIEYTNPTKWSIVELTQERLNKLVLNRPCILDILTCFTNKSIAQNNHPDKIIVPKGELYQIGEFLFNQEEGYKSAYTQELNKNIYGGILHPYPNVNLSNMLFYFRHDIHLWALDMRKIEYNPKPLLGYIPDKPWSVEEELLKVNKVNNNNNDIIYQQQNNLLLQMKGNETNSIKNNFHMTVQSYIYSNSYYTKTNNNNDDDDNHNEEEEEENNSSLSFFQ